MQAGGIVLSHYQAATLLEARRKGSSETLVSLDLNLSAAGVQLDSEGVWLAKGRNLPWEAVEEIAATPGSVFVVEEDGLRKVQFYSEATQRVYSLYPTAGAPTMLISGIPMHRIKDTDTHRDTLAKIKTIRPIVGKTLDTATGLGYTAIQAALTAEHVTTIELDPAALQVARLNPWSAALFDNPKITQLVGDSFDLAADMPEGGFQRILHDPPAFSLAGDLYSAEFYMQLLHVLRRGGRLFHYIGDPESKSGRNITAGVMHRLEQAGFRQIRRAPQAFGVTAIK
ncbi:MAG: spermine synthase [Chloroflexi bacterium]|nr:spermine synthase [Chloroflexota bacterium]